MEPRHLHSRNRTPHLQDFRFFFALGLCAPKAISRHQGEDQMSHKDWMVGHWMADKKLRLCSLSARGFWADMVSLMHMCEPRGYLQQPSGKPLALEHLARVAGCSVEG